MNYTDKAIQYTEKYGIIDYTVKGNILTYFESFILENAKYKATVNLDTMQETRKQVDTIH